jgi:hypothetical protein
MKACRPKRASTPASNAEAMAIGMRSMTRSNHPVIPTSVISTAQTMNAPTASPMPWPAPATASTAAPGVLQAIITGLRSHSDGSADDNPTPRQSAQIQELSRAGVAPKFCAAWNTIATELVKPTSTATKPAVTAERLQSLKNCMRGSCKKKAGRFGIPA